MDLEYTEKLFHISIHIFAIVKSYINMSLISISKSTLYVTLFYIYMLYYTMYADII